MKLKWYISIFILALTAFGIYQNKITSPNQEILVQFGSDEVSIEQTQTAIASIKQQLQSLGVEVIQVNNGEHGSLKIAYYSSNDVESIKKMLFESYHLAIDCTKGSHQKSRLPSDNNSKKYNLDIYELHQSHDGGHGAAGSSVLVVKQDYDQFFNPHVVLYGTLIDAFKDNSVVKEAYKVNSAIAIAIDTTSRTIPEVRAGPQTIVNG